MDPEYVPSPMRIVSPDDAFSHALLKVNSGEASDPSLLSDPPESAIATYHTGPVYVGVISIAAAEPS